MSLVVPLIVPFIQYKYDVFVRRLRKSNNKRALEFIKKHDMISNGISCSECNEILPLYHYEQNKNHKFGIKNKKCSKCISMSKCPYDVLLSSMK